MPTILPEGIRVPAGGDSYDLTNDLRKMMESATTIVPVANVGARTALVQALAAAGRAPSVAAPLYVDRADAPPLARLERSSDGATWHALYAGVGAAAASDRPGGGALGTAWTQADDPAVIRLSPGSHMVAASAGLTLSASAPTRISGHLFTAAGAPIGAGQEATTAVETAAGTTTRTLEWTRLVTVDVTTDVVMRLNTATVGGTQQLAAQHLVSMQVAI